MLESSIVYILVRTFPESVILVLSGVLLLGVNIEKKSLLKNGMLLGIAITLIRLLPINFGVHTILSMIALEFILYKNVYNHLLKTMIATCMVWVSLALSEAIYVIIATQTLNIQFEWIANNKNLGAAVATLPSLLILIGIISIFKILIKKLELL